ncbi:hypothetical protein PoB_004949900 [Plakobranchus ocellatus]|uniref:Uncharacterized protein n=1 Tax=Plakobranchus ocellatus TaxID=259542 RepID=A0AAV4BX52_9GAST|nr:hypothetical protein PoB_004949900 [Plakobranchus ocellatus]
MIHGAHHTTPYTKQKGIRVIVIVFTEWATNEALTITVSQYAHKFIIQVTQSVMRSTPTSWLSMHMRRDLAVRDLALADILRAAGR